MNCGMTEFLLTEFEESILYIYIYKADATHVTCASALNHVTLIEQFIASWEMERCSRFSAFAVGIFMRQGSRDISDRICCVPNVFLRLGKENLPRKVMKRPLKTLHSVTCFPQYLKITVGSSNFWSWSLGASSICW